ncbi:MAG: glutamate-5-semialdehyde dehydrogenase [Xanthomonadales bacterium]|nr:glutamate-5-semialdehyde dehydrogenase [Gammaproteobacteria bacterium]MBT8051598.1 glutamate-5-semialdehyde dehydrogenase [Gammaproteobacteria bacterium]MBT8056497.1 glutamate-5-semialdehyde dehydrogenase [Gammaproteobacteria bacterium]NNJ79112.1 glutamate-5-semialdehyde dehydrogenase [Xanthomonadales bacterium]NNL05201.1 glutamate-5-semialdehyde dehydrogenase [Xanthomonadales bacterium]
MNDTRSELKQGLEYARDAARALARCDDDTVRTVLYALADKVLANQDELLAANRSDLSRMPEDDPKHDRLLLNPARLEAICSDLQSVADLPSPIGETLEQRRLQNGLELRKVRVPMGVIAVIFESRPNVTFDVFALCLKTRNACVLKGSSDAHDTNRVAVRLMHETLLEHGIIPDCVFLAPPQREWLPHILGAVGYIDLAIPRGSQGLIDFVRDNASVPVIETGAGIVHTYVDASADLEKARAVITNAKTRRVSVCNALDTLVLHRDLLAELPALMRDMGERGVEVFADQQAFAALDGHYAAPLHRAGQKHFGQEFLSLRLSVKTVAGIGDALDHIHQYSSKHSEAVMAEDEEVLARFLGEVDAAAVYANTSTAFTDGGQFGMGAEIGISTQKLHARGPMALPELTSYKWIVRGDGQTRDAN